MGKKYDIIWYDSIDSTNLEAKRTIRSLDNMSVIAALCQFDGKGQGDHIWLTEPGLNLTFTIVLKYASQFPAAEQKRISDLSAESVADYLKSHGIDAWIKAPNDLWVGERKICGMLINHGICGENLSWSILGIGININQEVFPPELPNPVSLSMLTGKKYDIKKELESFLEIFCTKKEGIL